MKCVLFGGGGFIGSAIADRLLLDGHELRIFERTMIPPYRHFATHEQVDWVTGDLLNIHDVREALRDMDVVIHLVSTTLPKSSNDNPIYDVQSNLIASLQILDLMVEQQISKIVFISSGGTVYGTPEYLPIDEKHPTEPIVSYGITKLAIEKYLKMYRVLHGIQPVILRVANPYGERQRIETAQGAVGVFLYKAMHRQLIEIWGDGSITRDYIYVGDVASAFAKAVTYKGQHTVFNIGSGQGISLNLLLALIEDVLGHQVARQYLAGRLFDIPTSILCNQLAQSELGWTPMISMQDGLNKTVQWVQTQDLLGM